MGKTFKKLFLPLFIIAIMVMSGIGYMAGENSDEIIDYKGIRFSKVQSGWLTYSGDKQVILFNNPNDLEGIDIVGVSLNELNSAIKIYVSSNPEDNLGLYLKGFQFNILNNLKPMKVNACYEDNERCADLPLKDCSDASSNIKVILIKKGESLVEYENNCLLIQGQDEELLKYIDKLVLEMLLNGN